MPNTSRRRENGKKQKPASGAAAAIPRARPSWCDVVAVRTLLQRREGELKERFHRDATS
jgi:hypothetical protein